jgi:hypothetical protein
LLWRLTLQPARHGCPRVSLGPQIEKLLQEAADKEKELLAVLELTPIQIWRNER